jgi:predicted lipase
MRVNRRFLLWSGLGATIASVWGRDQWQRHAAEAEQAKLQQLYNPQTLVQEAFESDIAALKDSRTVQQSAKLRSPLLPYNRQWTKLLITGSKLCTHQYLRGKFDPKYDGSISTLPLYSQGFTTFQQVTSFKAAERLEEAISFELPTNDLATLPQDLNNIPNPVDHVKTAVENQVKQVVQLKQRISVYYGFLLSSPKMNILMFRGTQRQTEWIENVLALQTPYQNPATDQPLGKVHLGIYDFYQSSLAKSVREAVKSIDPKIPLLIAGHSLGSALATLAAMDVALLYPKLQPNLHLYAYAGPRVGDRAFIEAHSNLIPNHYRVVNLADTIPLLPMSRQLNAEFVHGGEQWSFLSYQGDIMPNHFVETYRNAIAQEAETRSK